MMRAVEARRGQRGTEGEALERESTGARARQPFFLFPSDAYIGVYSGTIQFSL